MAYIGTSPSNGVRRRFVYEATANQTSFSGNDENGITLTYVDSLYLDVYQNGVKLKAGDDYAATTGSTVVLVQGASADDVVEMIAFDIFSVGDTVSAKDGGNFGGNVGMAGTLAVTGTLGVTGVPTFAARSVHSSGITVANAGQIGSVGDADSIAIASNGVVTFSQKPVFSAGGAGGSELLQTVIADNDATVTVGSSSLFTTTHKVYILHVINAHPITDSQEFRCRLSKGGTVLEADYEYTRNQHIHSSGFTNRGSNSDDHVNLAESLGNGNDECHNMVITIFNPAETAFKKLIKFTSAGMDLSPNMANNDGMFGHEGNSAAIDGIQFFYASGNISTGTFKLYGVV